MSPRLFLKVLSLSTVKRISYRAEFWVNSFAGFFVEVTIAYCLWSTIFDQAGREEIGGFSRAGMIAYYVLAALVGKIVAGPDRNFTFATDVYEGALTRYLLYPTSYFGYKYAEHLGALAPALLQLAVCGGGALLLFGAPADTPITATSVLMSLGAMLAANLLFFVIVVPIQGVAFWADSVWSLLVMYRFAAYMLGGLLVPLSLFPEPVRTALDLLPFKYLFAFPVMTLLGRVTIAEWVGGLAIMALWGCVIGLIGRWVWRRGDLVYTGVGI